MIPVLVAHLSVLAVTATAAVTDARTGRIPNWLTLPPIPIAILLYGLVDGWRGLVTSIVGMLVCGAVPYLMFIKGGMMGGDVKLFAAIGAMAGTFIGLEIQLLSLGVGMVYTFGRLAWHGKLWRTLANSLKLALNIVLPKKMQRKIESDQLNWIRFGPAIFAGAVIALAMRHPWLWSM